MSVLHGQLAARRLVAVPAACGNPARGRCPPSPATTASGGRPDGRSTAALDFRGRVPDDHGVIKVRGQPDGQEVVTTLDDDGQLVGSSVLVAGIDELIAHEARVGIGDVVTGRAALDEDRIAHATLLAPLDHGTGRLAGDPPRIDRIPAGAEA